MQEMIDRMRRVMQTLEAAATVLDRLELRVLAKLAEREGRPQL